jgi:hypothetical protein
MLYVLCEKLAKKEKSFKGKRKARTCGRGSRGYKHVKNIPFSAHILLWSAAVAARMITVRVEDEPCVVKHGQAPCVFAVVLLGP